MIDFWRIIQNYIACLHFLGYNIQNIGETMPNFQVMAYALNGRTSDIFLYLTNKLRFEHQHRFAHKQGHHDMKQKAKNHS